MIRWRADKSGFSLVELLIAFFVLLVGILAVLVLFPLGLRESKTMVDASTAAFAARNARNLMDVFPFTYNGNKAGNGVASLIQIRFGPRETILRTAPANFPIMFPWDVLAGNEDATFPLSQRLLDTATGQRDRVIDTSNAQFSWDARFTIGGGPGVTPPPGFTFATNDDWKDQYYRWFSQYFKYYAVQISVYRGYETLKKPDGSDVMSGTVTVRAAKKSDGSDYATDDPNRPLYSEIVLSAQPPIDLTVDSYMRIRDDKSDWYRVTNMAYDSGASTWTFRLDRPYAGLDIGQQPAVSANKADIIATNTLIESFTTILGSQLDDVDTSSLTYP